LSMASVVLKPEAMLLSSINPMELFAMGYATISM